MVKLTFPGGVTDSRRKIILLIAFTASSWPVLVASNSTEPSSGYTSVNGTENVAGPGSASRGSFGATSLSLVASTSNCPKRTALVNVDGGVQRSQAGDCQSGKSARAAASA